MKEKEDKSPTIKYSPGFYTQGAAFEQVSEQQYALSSQPELEDERHAESYDVVYRPLPRCPWPLASRALECPPHKELWNEINGFIREHLFLPSEELYDVLTAWVLATWTPEKWTVIPYVFFCGPVASGKTRGLEILQRLSYRGILASNISGPALFRSCEEWHPTLFLDETEIYNDATKADVIGLLNSGYRKGQYAIRAKRTDHGTELETFDVFGFKALAGTNALALTLESRSIIVRMMKNRAPIKRKIDEERALEIRNKLLGWRFHELTREQLNTSVNTFAGNQHQNEQCEQYEQFLGSVSLNFGDGRLNELFECILSVARDNRENILRYAKEICDIRAFEEETSNEAEIIRILVDNPNEIENNFIYTKRVRELFNESRDENEQWKTVSVGYLLRRLGFDKKHLGKGNGWIIYPSRLKYLAHVYGVEEKEEVYTLRTVQTVQTIQNNIENDKTVHPTVHTVHDEEPLNDGAEDSAERLRQLREMMKQEPKT